MPRVTNGHFVTPALRAELDALRYTNRLLHQKLERRDKRIRRLYEALCEARRR